MHAEKFKPEGFEYDFSTIPVPDGFEGPIYTYGDPKNIVIFNTNKDPQYAWEFIKFMISKENDLKLLEITTQLPRRKHLDTDSSYMNYFTMNPKMKTVNNNFLEPGRLQQLLNTWAPMIAATNNNVISNIE